MKQPEALRLAIELIEVHNGHADEGQSTFSEAAAELRRLHGVNQELVKVMATVSVILDSDGDEMGCASDLREAIKKATGGQS